MTKQSINPFLPDSKYEPSNGTIPILPVLIIFLGFSIRFFSFHYTHIINPDGTLYIQQAKAIYYGLNSMVTVCYPYLSAYPIFVVGSFKIFGDWIVAAKTVSLFFGTLSLIPLYLLIRRFCSEIISCLCLLIFAFNPTLVAVSADTLRDPIYWFFSLLGLYFFVLYTEKNHKNYLLIFSSVAFILGIWARIEAIVFMVGSSFFLLITDQRKKLKSLFFFLIFPVIIFLIGIAPFFILNEKSLDLFAIQKIPERLFGAIENYQTLREYLSKLIEQRSMDISPYFFPKVRNLLWLVALGAIFVQIVRAIFLPFFVIFAAGFIGLKKRINQDHRLIYLAVLCVFALLTFIFQILDTWAMVSRFIVLFLFPSVVLIGFGLENIIRYLRAKFKWKDSAVVVLLCMLILSVGLSKNLKHRGKDKIVFKEVGEFIANRGSNGFEILVAGSFRRLRLVNFYANLKCQKAPCFNSDLILKSHDINSLRILQQKGLHYFIWDEKNWSANDLDLIRRKYSKTLVEVRSWNSPHLGKVVLFEVKE